MLPPALARMSALLRAVPPSLDRPLARAAGLAWSRMDRARARAVRANRAALGASFPLARPFSSYLEALAGWLRLLRLSGAEVAARTRCDGFEAFAREARARGVVLIAAHVGEWEWGAAAIAARGLPVIAVAGTQMSPRWSAALATAKARLGISVVGPEVSALRLVRALRQGGVVALLIDGDVATALGPARVAGRATALPLGPARLVARTGAALFAGRCERDPIGGAGFYHVRLTPLAVATADRERSRDGVAAAHAAVAAWLGQTVLVDPGRWCLFRPLFESPDVAWTGPGVPRSHSAAG